ncbi:MAG: hypothetical protein NTZ65_05140 [Candidatus Berkelbacteria bacterium]|nr:hypothetical protein [Candidatus Berkelbacteria bacterium]
MENIIGLKDLRKNLPDYEKKIASGATFLVLKKSKPIFRISPVFEQESEWEEAIDFTKMKKGGVAIEDLLKRL